MIQIRIRNTRPAAAVWPEGGLAMPLIRVVSQSFCVSQAFIEIVGEVTKAVVSPSVRHLSELRMEQIPIRTITTED